MLNKNDNWNEIKNGLDEAKNIAKAIFCNPRFTTFKSEMWQHKLWYKVKTIFLKDAMQHKNSLLCCLSWTKSLWHSEFLYVCHIQNHRVGVTQRAQNRCENAYREQVEINNVQLAKWFLYSFVRQVQLQHNNCKKLLKIS